MFFGAIFRALSLLPGGLGRFLPGGFGANHCRLRHIGWDKCSHGLSSRPRETSSVWFLEKKKYEKKRQRGAQRGSTRDGPKN